jgi:transcriptional regulator with XRE-family HTH domain
MSTSLGELLRLARQREGLSQTRLAEKVGVTQAAVSNWENNGNVPDAKRHELEAVLGPLEEEQIEEAQISSFGIWLIEQRTKASLTVAELARASGVSPPAIYNIENGRIQNPQASTRNRLAAALQENVPTQVVDDTEKNQSIAGLGSLTDFDPHSRVDWPRYAGVYVLYDISQRPIYVGKGDDISRRLQDHHQKFWFRSPIVQFGSYVAVPDKALRHQIEQTLIKFLKSNAVINKQSTEEFADDP